MDMNLERACARMARANSAMRHDVFFVVQSWASFECRGWRDEAKIKQRA